MKAARYGATVLLVALCIIFTSELFQDHVETFSSGMYFSRVMDMAGDDIYTRTAEAANESGIVAFAVRQITNSLNDLSCTIYADEEAIDMLEGRFDICQGRFNSLISGSSTITVKSFDSYAELAGSAEQRIYFIGNDTRVTDAVDIINGERECLSSPTRERLGRFWIIYAVWGLALAFLLLLTWFSLQFDRKKDFIKISMGVSRRRIIILGAASDAAIFAAVFALLYLLLSRIIYVGYASSWIIAESSIYIILNSLLHLTLLRYDHKSIIYGANLNQKLVANCYVLKALVMMITIASVSLNAVWIKENVRYLKMYKYIYAFEDYYKLDFILPDDTSYEDSNTLSKSVPGELLVDGYCDGRVALASMITSYGNPGEEIPLFIYNSKSESMLSVREIRDILNEGYDFYLFIPEKLRESSAARQAEEGFTELLYYTFDIKEDRYSWKVYYYENSFDLLYFEFDNLAITEYGFEIADDPVFIYCATLPEEMQMMIIGDGIPYTAIGMEVLFDFNEEELPQLAKDYKVKNFERTSVAELCNRHKAVFLRIVMLNSLMSAFMLFLSISIMLSIVKLEYRVNAKLLAVKKVLGYSFVRNNLFMLFLNALTVVTGIVANIFLAIIAGDFRVTYPCIVGILLLAAETIIMFFYAVHMERADTAKILKGGSL